MRINRADFLRQLELVTPGLSPKKLWSNLVLCIPGAAMALTYNDEVRLPRQVRCSIPTSLGQ